MTDRLKEHDIVAMLVDVPKHRVHRGDIGTVVEVVAPTTGDSGYVLLEFDNGAQTDIDRMSDIVKLNSRPKARVEISQRQTLQQWAGTSQMFALVFTDIVDSTKIANEFKDRNYVEMLKKHFAQARALLAGVDHHEIKILGDSFMVAFRTASEALRFALKLKVEPGHP